MPRREDLLGIAYVCVGGGRPISPVGLNTGSWRGYVLATLCAYAALF